MDEPQEIRILEEDVEDVLEDVEDVLEDVEDVHLPEPSDTVTASTAVNDVIVLEESTVVSAAPVLVTSAPETDSECKSPCPPVPLTLAVPF